MPCTPTSWCSFSLFNLKYSAMALDVTRGPGPNLAWLISLNAKAANILGFVWCSYSCLYSQFGSLSGL